MFAKMTEDNCVTIKDEILTVLQNTDNVSVWIANAHSVLAYLAASETTLFNISYLYKGAEIANSIARYCDDLSPRRHAKTLQKLALLKSQANDDADKMHLMHCERFYV